MADLNTRFILTERNIRGQIVQLESVTQAAFATADYPLSVRDQLGQALAATAALASTIKLDGSIILQLQGDGEMPLLVAQASNEGKLRGLAQFDIKDLGKDNTEAQAFDVLAGDGRIVITIDGEGGHRYQGIVEISGDSLQLCLANYFERSEQLTTQLYLVAEGDKAAALLLQQLPLASGGKVDFSKQEFDQDSSQSSGPLDEHADWQHVKLLADTLQDDELLELSAKEIIHRLFHAEDVRLFEPQTLQFHCSCSRDKVAVAIKSLGREEAELIVQEQGRISADCEFCNQAYRFDAVDVATVFEDGVSASSQIH